MGLLLFIIFINDLVDICTNNIKLFLIADDAKMYCQSVISYHISYIIHTNVLEHTRHTSALTVAQKHNETFQRNSTELKS